MSPSQPHQEPMVYVIMGEKGSYTSPVYIARSEAEAASIIREKINFRRLGGDPLECPWGALNCVPMRMGIWVDLVELEKCYAAAGKMALVTEVCNWADPVVAAQGRGESARAGRVARRINRRRDKDA